MEKRRINIKLNGRWKELLVPPHELLVDTLRETLHLTGTKKACGQGDCGACTVLLNNKAVNSCLVLSTQADGAELLTIEGLGTREDLHPIQKAFVEHGAIQCGYCTPGVIMSVKALLEANPHPEEAEIREGLSGNLCRCGGYVQMIEAVKSLSK